jgi:excinuclease ABC subunit C
MVKKSLKSKLAKLPKSPGVYFHKDNSGEIIYIGKAANLKSRLSQYFQPSTALRALKTRDAKTAQLISEIADVDWIEVESEADALFLEAELVRRYLPKYNIMLRDDKSAQYVRIDYNSDYPTVRLVRRPLDDGAKYFGPYLNSFAIKKALRYLRRAFPYAISRPTGQKRSNLYFHLGLDPGLEDGRTSLAEYRANLRQLMQYLKGKRSAIINQIERQMKKAAESQKFEEAARYRNQLFALKALSQQVLFGNQEILDVSRDHALVELAELLKLNNPPRRIEGFDISHIQGTDITASMVVFTDGLPDKAAYRKFKMRTPGNDDYAHIFEALSRRLTPTNLKKWGTPDVVLIDGGKGQLSAAMAARDQSGYHYIPMLGLAKRFEQVIVKKSDDKFSVINLPTNSHLVKLLQRIRDESHRFALSYHSALRRVSQTSSLLDEIPGIGPITKKKLIRHFGSAQNAIYASSGELEALLGSKTGAKLAYYLKALKMTKG